MIDEINIIYMYMYIFFLLFFFGWFGGFQSVSGGVNDSMFRHQIYSMTCIGVPVAQ